MLDSTLKVPLSTITTPLNRLAKRAVNAAEKSCIYNVVDAVGTNIAKDHPGFDLADFGKACGVSPEWATQAA